MPVFTTDDHKRTTITGNILFIFCEQNALKEVSRKDITAAFIVRQSANIRSARESTISLVVISDGRCCLVSLFALTD